MYALIVVYVLTTVLVLGGTVLPYVWVRHILYADEYVYNSRTGVTMVECGACYAQRHTYQHQCECHITQ